MSVVMSMMGMQLEGLQRQCKVCWLHAEWHIDLAACLLANPLYRRLDCTLQQHGLDQNRLICEQLIAVVHA